MAFIGRERELAHLATALQRAAATGMSRVAIVGPAGIGASRLLSELQERLGGLPGIVVVRGAAYESCSGVPYQALTSALGPVLTALPDERLAEVCGPAGHDLALLLPHLSEQLGRLGAVPTDLLHSSPDQRASRLSESVLGTLQRLASPGVALLVLEDLHWADPGTTAFVDSLVRTSRRLPLCLVVSYRPDEIHRHHPGYALTDALRERPSVDVLPLEPLRRDDIVRFVEGLAGERPSAAFIAAVVEGSGGNPFLIEQLVAARTSLEGLRLSDPFEELLQARMSVLSGGAVRCLRVLAAARRPLSRSLLLELELPDGRLSPAGIADALASGLAVLEPLPDGAPGSDQVGLVHDRCAEAIEAVALPEDRQLVHACLAVALADRPAEAAWHWEAAMRLPEARTAHVFAGTDAERVEPGGTALTHYLRAVEIPDQSDGTEAPTPFLLARAAQAAFVEGSFRRATTLVEQAIAERSSSAALTATAARGDSARRQHQVEVALLHERLGKYRWASGDLLPAIAALETAVQLVPPEPTRERAQILGTLAQHLMLDGRFHESTTLAEQARDIARELGEPALGELGHATCTLGVDVAYAGDLEGGLRLLEEAISLSRRAGRLDDVMRAYANRSTLLDLNLRREASLAVVKEGIAEARRWGMEGVYGAFLRGNAAEALFLLGRWREAEAECRQALEWNPTGVAWFVPLLYLGQIVVEARADEEASRVVGQILLQLEAVPEGQWTARVQRTAVSFALWRDDLADAQRAATRGWERVRQTDDWAQTAMAASTTLEVCAAVAEAGRAHRNFASVAEVTALGRSVLKEAEARVAAAGEAATLGARIEADLHLATARAHLSRVLGRADMEVWDTIAEDWSRIPVPYQVAKARWWQGAAALRARDARPQAREALLEAWRIAAELPARPLQREIADLCTRGRIPLPAPETADERRRDPVAVGPGKPAGLRRVSDAAASAEQWLRTELQTDDETSWGSLTGRQIEERLRSGPSAPTADPFGLSPRESEVLKVLSEGRTNREIAERLFISERTVGVHVRRILAKLGVSGRVEAASVAIRLGLVPGTEQGVHRS